MNNWALVSIIPFIGILFLTWRILRVARSASNRMNWTRRLNKWIIFIYVGLLIVSVIVYECIPTEGNKVVGKKTYQLLQNENDAFQRAFENNDESKLDIKFLVEEWTQKLDGDTLEIVSNGSTFPMERMNIEWTNSKEQLVEVKIYKTNLYKFGVNVREEIPLSRIEMQNDRLIVTAPPQKEVKYYRFSNELVILSIADTLNNSEYRRGLGGAYIYLKVPKHINVIDENGSQFY